MRSTLRYRGTLLWPVVLACCILATGMAVDQSKFRKCEQTSFCRRHRGQHSASLYEYRVDENSVTFHLPNENKDDSDDSREQKKNVGSNADADTGLWKSLQNRILGGSSFHSNGSSEHTKDPFVRGPPPTLTGFDGLRSY